MRWSLCRLDWWCIALATVFGGAYFTYPQSSCANEIKISATPRKSEIFPGEPLVVDVKITNPLDHAVTISLGYDGIQAFWFEVYDEKNDVVSSSRQIQRGGWQRFVRRRMEPGGVERAHLVMNRWCSTLLPPAAYSVSVNWETVSTLADCQVKGGQAFDLIITKGENEDLKRLLIRLKEDALDPESDTQWLSREMLLHSQAPVAVEPISEYLSALPIPGSWGVKYRLDALEALGRIETVESVRILEKFAVTDEPTSEGRIERHAVAMIYRIFDNSGGKPAVQKACQDVMQIRPRPRLPSTPVD